MTTASAASVATSLPPRRRTAAAPLPAWRSPASGRAAGPVVWGSTGRRGWGGRPRTRNPGRRPDHSRGTRTVRGLTFHHLGGCGLSEEACQAGLRCKRREVPVSATSTSRRLAGSASPWPPWDSATDVAPRRRVAVGAIGAVVVAPRSRRPPGLASTPRRAATCGDGDRRARADAVTPDTDAAAGFSTARRDDLCEGGHPGGGGGMSRRQCGFRA